MSRRHSDTSTDVSTLTCPITELERDFCDAMRAATALTSDADLVRTALYRFACHLDVPVGIQTFVVRGGTSTCRNAKLQRRWRMPREKKAKVPA